MGGQKDDDVVSRKVAKECRGGWRCGRDVVWKIDNLGAGVRRLNSGSQSGPREKAWNKGKKFPERVEY